MFVETTLKMRSTTIIFLIFKLTLIFIAKFLVIVIVIQLLSSARAQDNICEGNFGLRLPDPRRCYAYIFCNLNIPMFHECEEGKIFDSITRECLPGSRTTCQLFDFDAICAGLFFDARPHPDENNNKEFVGCIKSKPNIYVCIDDKFFDKESKECKSVERTSPEIPSGTTPIITVTSSTTTETPPTDQPNPCLGVQNGIKLLT